MNDDLQFEWIETPNKTFRVDVLINGVEIGEMRLSEFISDANPNYLMVADVYIEEAYQKIGAVSRRIGLQTYKFALMKAQEAGYDGLCSNRANQNSYSHALWEKYATRKDYPNYFMTNLIIESKKTFKEYLKENEIDQEDDQFLKTKEEIETWLIAHRVKRYKINDDLSIDVDGNVNISFKSFKRIPVQFGIVTGNFGCNNNELITLKGSPREVGGYFNCCNNQLTSLEFGPTSAGKSYECSENYLTTLLGAPRSVDGYFNCTFNELTNLEYAPREVNGDFYCNNNKLTTLKGSIKEVHQDFFCDNNNFNPNPPDYSFIEIGGRFQW
jgi:hypothetical protein